MPAISSIVATLVALALSIFSLYFHPHTSPAGSQPIPTSTAAPESNAIHAPDTALTASSTASLLASSTNVAATLAPFLSSSASTELAVALGELRDSLVNIICISDTPAVRSSSGSGVFFDSRGLILTNSHIAQYFLLAKLHPDLISCVIRTGNPARTAYIAEPAYVSSTWLHEHPDTLITAKPKGTGEHDFAVLAVTNSATANTLPERFPAVPLSHMDPEPGQAVGIGSYGVQNLTSKEIVNSLYLTLVFAKIEQEFTFKHEAVDLISLGGSAAAQGGSSGGGVVNDQGELMGIITTSTQTGDLFTRDLRAITAEHMRLSFEQDTDEDFDAYFSKNEPRTLVNEFSDTAQELSSFLGEQVGI